MELLCAFVCIFAKTGSFAAWIK